jgi:hypothetical protein
LKDFSHEDYKGSKGIVETGATPAPLLSPQRFEYAAVAKHCWHGIAGAGLNPFVCALQRFGYHRFHVILQIRRKWYERWIGLSARRWQLIRRRRKYRAAKPHIG